MIEHWLGTVPLSTFLEQHYLRRPFSLPDTAARFTRYATWETLDLVLRHEVPPDVLVVRDGRLLDRRPPRSLEEVQTLFAEGCSVVVRSSEKHEPGLLELATAFERDLRARVAIQLYATPGEHHSFGWHFDAEEVFILQTIGSKDYYLRENTVHPHPVLEAMPYDMHYELERGPTMACTLLPGSWLYVPNGWWHRAAASGDSLSISIGVLPPTGVDVMRRLTRLVVQSPAWRQRLVALPPPPPGAAATPDPSFTHLAALGQELAQLLGDEQFMRSLLLGLESELLSAHQAARFPQPPAMPEPPKPPPFP